LDGAPTEEIVEGVGEVNLVEVSSFNTRTILHNNDINATAFAIDVREEGGKLEFEFHVDVLSTLVRLVRWSVLFENLRTTTTNNNSNNKTRLL
jgi:hypothetical protein